MSIVFSIKNKKSLFGYQKVLPAKEVLELIEGMVTYNYDEQLLVRPLSDFQVLLCIVYGKSGLPLQLRFDEQEEAYQLKVPALALEEDWQLALRWLSQLAKKMGSPILSSRGEEWSVDSIFRYDYEVELLESLRQLSQESDWQQFELQGFAHPVYLDHSLLHQILDARQPLEEFSNVVKEIQYSPAYFSQPRFYQHQESGGFLASFSLTEDTETVLPRVPRVPHVPAEYAEVVEIGGLIDWRVNLVAIEGDPAKQESYHAVGSLALEQVFEELQSDEVTVLDANQVVIHPLRKERLLELVKDH